MSSIGAARGTGHYNPPAGAPVPRRKLGEPVKIVLSLAATAVLGAGGGARAAKASGRDMRFLS